MTNLCPSCREPLDYPSGDGCAAMTMHQPVTKPNWEAFGSEIMEAWPEGGVDGFELQDAAVKHGVLRETAYDFKAHGKEGPYDWGLQEGDVYFERNYK